MSEPKYYTVSSDDLKNGMSFQGRCREIIQDKPNQYKPGPFSEWEDATWPDHGIYTEFRVRFLDKELILSGSPFDVEYQETTDDIEKYFAYDGDDVYQITHRVTDHKVKIIHKQGAEESEMLFFGVCMNEPEFTQAIARNIVK